jgi:hypothetical protein
MELDNPAAGRRPRARSEGDHGHISTEPAELIALGVKEPHRDRSRDVLIRTALGTDAGVRIVPRDQAPKDGAGLILRWTTD